MTTKKTVTILAIFALALMLTGIATATVSALPIQDKIRQRDCSQDCDFPCEGCDCPCEGDMTQKRARGSDQLTI